MYLNIPLVVELKFCKGKKKERKKEETVLWVYSSSHAFSSVRALVTILVCANRTGNINSLKYSICTCISMLYKHRKYSYVVGMSALCNNIWNNNKTLTLWWCKSPMVGKRSEGLQSKQNVFHGHHLGISIWYQMSWYSCHGTSLVTKVSGGAQKEMPWDHQSQWDSSSGIHEWLCRTHPLAGVERYFSLDQVVNQHTDKQC